MRDRGVGFDPSTVADDRHGRPRQSIIGRMERHGGSASVAQHARRGHRGRARRCPNATARPQPHEQGDPSHDHAQRRHRRRPRHVPHRRPVRARHRVDVVAEAADVDQAVRPSSSTSPEVVLLDVHLPGGGGAEVMRRMHGRSRRHQLPRALVSRRRRGRDRRSIRAGARGYVTKTITGPELVAAIERVAARRRRVLAPARGLRPRRVRRHHRGRPGRRGPRPAHRARARGDAADRPRLRLQGGRAELFISIKTVETHVSSVLRKLQLSCRHELTRWANDRRLL